VEERIHHRGTQREGEEEGEGEEGEEGMRRPERPRAEV
jgi:hypothetical protein